MTRSKKKRKLSSRRSEKSKSLRNILLLIITIILFIIISELFFRVLLNAFAYRNFVCEQQDIDCFLEMWDEHYTEFLQNYSIIKPNNTFRIVTIGDSFTYGDGIFDGQSIVNQSYPIQLEKILSDTANTSEIYNISNKNYFDNIEVMNFGFSGSTPLEQYFIMENFVFKYNPDLVIIQITGNDLFHQGYNLDPLTYCGLNLSVHQRFKLKVLREWKLLNYLNIHLLNVKKGHPQVNKFESEWGFSCLSNSLVRMKNSLQKRSIPSFVIYVYDVAFFNFKNTFSDESLYFKDYFDPEYLIPFEKSFSDDMYHYNPYGNKLLAEKVSQYILK